MLSCHSYGCTQLKGFIRTQGRKIRLSGLVAFLQIVGSAFCRARIPMIEFTIENVSHRNWSPLPSPIRTDQSCSEHHYLVPYLVLKPTFAAESTSMCCSQCSSVCIHMRNHPACTRTIILTHLRLLQRSGLLNLCPEIKTTARCSCDIWGPHQGV